MHITMTVHTADPRRDEIGATCAKALRERFNTLGFTLDVQVVGLKGEDRGAARYTGGTR